MFNRVLALTLFVSAGLFAETPGSVRAFLEGRQLTESDLAQLEASLSSNPENMDARARLIGFYASAPQQDVEWSHRLPLLSWTAEHHPESELLSLSSLWTGLPEPMFQMLKAQWVTQVHQHADDPLVLRNASVFLSSKNPMPATIRIGAGVAASNLVSKVDPVYPPLAKQAHIQGTVRTAITISEDGHIVNATLVNGHPLLVQAALDAVQQWVYKPTLLNGKPVQVTTTADLNFALNN